MPALQKWQMTTAAEHRASRKAERKSTETACYRDVDQRDGGCDRVTGAFLWPGHVDPKLRREHHHMTARSRGGPHESPNVITISAWLHLQIHAGKARLSGDANLRDAEGKFCGVTLERLTDAGWSLEATL